MEYCVCVPHLSSHPHHGYSLLEVAMCKQLNQHIGLFQSPQNSVRSQNTISECFGDIKLANKNIFF